MVGNPEKPHVKFSTELKGHAAPIEKVAFNPTKDAELCSVSSDGVVKFWDVRTKNCFNEVKGLEDAFTLVWAPDGETLVVGNKVRERPHTSTSCLWPQPAKFRDSLTRFLFYHQRPPPLWHRTSSRRRRTRSPSAGAARRSS